MNMKNNKVVEDNYRKLWLIERLNAKFWAAVGLLRDKWKLPLPCKDDEAFALFRVFLGWLEVDDEEYFTGDKFIELAPVINMVTKISLPEETKREIYNQLLEKMPSKSFLKDIKNLAIEFEFEEFWIPTLALYIVTNRVYPPKNQTSKNVPLASAIKDYHIFLLAQKKEAQHSFLKKEYQLDEYDIAELDSDTNKLPTQLLHQYADIADIAYGELDWDSFLDEEIPKEEKKRIDRIKQAVKKTRERIVTLTKEEYHRLRTIFG